MLQGAVGGSKFAVAAATHMMMEQQIKIAEKRRFALLGLFLVSCSIARSSANPLAKKVGMVINLIEQTIQSILLTGKMMIT